MIFQKTALFFIIILASSCKTGQNQNSNKKESGTLDLLALKEGALEKEAQAIASLNDPVYHKDKEFLAIELLPFLEKYLTEIKTVNASQHKIVFTCEDGYQPEMPLQKFMAVKSFLAIADLGVNKETKWENLQKDGHPMKVDPYYIFYDPSQVSTTDFSYSRPYNLVSISIEPIQKNSLVAPKIGTDAYAGYEIFMARCKTCHALGGIGGKMGPELHTPKNISTYWKREDLVNFIVNPAKYRDNVKMPALGLSIKEAEQVVSYLEYLQ